jgi:hypothetical protein
VKKPPTLRKCAIDAGVEPSVEHAEDAVVVAAESHSRFGFAFQGKITAAFDGGEITRDAGWLLVRKFDDRLGLTAALRTRCAMPAIAGT